MYEIIHTLLDKLESINWNKLLDALHPVLKYLKILELTEFTFTQ